MISIIILYSIILVNIKARADCPRFLVFVLKGFSYSTLLCQVLESLPMSSLQVCLQADTQQ